MIAIDLVGCGEVALQFHAPVIRYLARAGMLRISGCYDRSPVRARRIAGLVGAVTWATEPPAVPDPSVRAAVIATPPDSHAALASPYLRGGRTVLLEKPFVTTPAEADRLLAEAAASGGRVLVGHMRRFTHGLRVARSMVVAGGIGTLQRVVATEGGRWSWATASNYPVQDTYGGVLFDLGSHVVDSVLFILGADRDHDPTITVRQVTKDRPGEPSHHFRAEFSVARTASDPVLAHLTVSRTTAMPGVIRLEGEKGTLIVPTAIDGAPSLLLGETLFHLDARATGVTPRDVLGCFREQYRTLVAAAAQRDLETVLDGQRFVNTTRVLSALARG